jgi:hypothetical protein
LVILAASAEGEGRLGRDTNNIVIAHVVALTFRTYGVKSEEEKEKEIIRK